MVVQEADPSAADFPGECFPSVSEIWRQAGLPAVPQIYIYVILDLLTTGIARPAEALVPDDINTVVQEFCHLKDQHFWT